jgi:hypothetical protein
MKQKHIAIFLFFTSIAAVAEVPDSSRIAGIDGNGSDCIWLRTVRDYTTLDDRNLLIRGSGNRSYLVTLQHRSFDLKSSMGLSFASRDDQLCPYGGDAIVFEGLSKESVRIRSISRVSREQADELMVRFGKKEADEQKIPAPEPVEGADIEELD